MLSEPVTVMEWYQATSQIGYNLMIIIAALVIAMILATLFTKPRSSPILALIIAFLVITIAALILSSYILQVIFSQIIP
ncbi:MAG: hypothetical protein HA494_04840 [Thaumarchaeota archaeon]|jgi:CBS domain containing-hemolysin-like protein|nr:hypothetical protein [Nitrososphaerota archaeon]